MGRFYLLAAVIILTALIVTISFIVSTYKACPPGHIMIINYSKPDDFGNMFKIISSGGAFIWPVFSSYQLYSLAPIPISLHENILAKNNERVNIEVKINVGISTSETVLKNAIDRFSGLSILQIKQVAHDIILSQLRTVVASSDKKELEEIIDMKKKFAQEIEGDLMTVGLKLINLDVKSIETLIEGFDNK